MELFLADAETGEVTRKLLKTSTDPHFDSLEFVSLGRRLESGRPHARRLRAARRAAGAGVDRSASPARFGESSSSRASTTRSIRCSRLMAARWCCRATPAVCSICTATRSTAARSSGSRNDPFADLEPAFTPDGRTVVFATERYTTSLETLEPGPMRLAAIDLATRTMRPIAGVSAGQAREPAGHRGRRLGRLRRRPGRSQQHLSRADWRRAHRTALDRGDGRRRHHVDEPDAQFLDDRPAGLQRVRGRRPHHLHAGSGGRRGARAVVGSPSTRPSCRAAPCRPGDVQRMLADSRGCLPAASARMTRPSRTTER